MKQHIDAQFSISFSSDGFPVCRELTEHLVNLGGFPPYVEVTTDEEVVGGLLVESGDDAILLRQHPDNLDYWPKTDFLGVEVFELRVPWESIHDIHYP